MVKFMNDIEDIKELRNIPKGEIKFYNILEVLDDNWLVWFSNEWYYQDSNQIDFSEADFLIFNKNYGFVVIEVKGGNITNDNRGKWYTNGKKLKGSPFHQAQNSMFFFRDNYIKAVKLKRRENELLNRRGDFPLSYIFVVAFPDCKYKKYMDIFQARGNQDFIFDEDDLLENLEWMRKKNNGTGKPPLEKWLVDQFKKRQRWNHGLSLNNICKFFINTISDAVKTKISLSAWIENKDKVFKKINKEQDRIINLFKYKSKAAFIGSAGTGKTFIAIKKIIHEFKQNDQLSVLYLCYNRALKGFVRNAFMTQLKLSNVKMKKGAQRLTIRNIDSFISKLIKDYDQKVHKYNEYIQAVKKSDQEAIMNLFKELITHKEFKTKYDVILIDEAQDFRKEHFTLIRFLLKDPIKSRVWIFYDNSQTIFQNDIESIPLDFLGLNGTKDKIFLSVNLRNTKNIVDWYKKESDYGLYSEILSKSKQDIISVDLDSFSSAIDETIKIIRDLEKNFIELSRVVILGDYKLEYLYNNKSNLNIIKTTIRKKQSNDIEFISYELTRDGIIISEPSKNYFDAYNSPNHFYDKYKRIFYSTIGSYKGLESDIIILLLNRNLDLIKEKDYKKLIYIGASRAKFLLYVLNHNEKV